MTTVGYPRGDHAPLISEYACLRSGSFSIVRAGSRRPAVVRSASRGASPSARRCAVAVASTPIDPLVVALTRRAGLPMTGERSNVISRDSRAKANHAAYQSALTQQDSGSPPSDKRTCHTIGRTGGRAGAADGRARAGAGQPVSRLEERDQEGQLAGAAPSRQHDGGDRGARGRARRLPWPGRLQLPGDVPPDAPGARRGGVLTPPLGGTRRGRERGSSTGRRSQHDGPREPKRG